RLASARAVRPFPTRRSSDLILVFLGVVIGSALALYAWRAHTLDSDAGFRLLSRETFLLLNNVLLVIAAALVLFGTLSPLAVQWRSEEHTSELQSRENLVCRL